MTGAGGQIGSELVPALRERYGEEAVLASDIRAPKGGLIDGGPFEIIDATDQHAVGHATIRHNADTIYHLAAILSAVGEKDPRLAYRVNMGTLHSVLEVARDQGCAVFTPSSIGVFGPSTPSDPAPQDTIMRPTTMYGVTKVAAELLCDYYHLKYGVDTRGVRYPGLISHGAPPGGGTTDWAVDIFYPRRRRRPVHMLPGARHATRHDVHAGRYQRGHRGHGGRPDPSGSSQRLQRHGHAVGPRDTRGGDPRAHP